MVTHVTRQTGSANAMMAVPTTTTSGRFRRQVPWPVAKTSTTTCTASATPATRATALLALQTTALWLVLEPQAQLTARTTVSRRARLVGAAVIAPEQGTAVFWYNHKLLEEHIGDLDIRSLNGDCRNNKVNNDPHPCSIGTNTTNHCSTGIFIHLFHL